jgi:hypothetical protein
MTTHWIYFIAAAAVLSLAACSGNPQQSETTAGEGPATTQTEKAVVAEQKTLGGVVMGYLALKDALVASNPEDAQARAVDLLKMVDATKTPDIQQNVKEMAAATDLAAQRTYFDSLSMNLYEQVKEHGAPHQTLYKQHCPMAFDNRGAFWLSANREIENPYFGDEMLKCGRVEEEISSQNAR